MTQLVTEPRLEQQADLPEEEQERPPLLMSRLTRPVRALRAVPHLGTWAGVLLSTVGLVLIAVAWGRTAGLTNVALQTPYVISAGFTGLGLVVTGLAAVSITAKHEESAERRRQLGELRELLADLRAQAERRS